MKRALFLLVLGFLIFSVSGADARGKSFGFLGCNELGYGGPYCRNIENYKNFRRETIDLREKINKKRFELERELLAENPDSQKVRQIEKEIGDMWSELQKIREKHKEELGKLGFQRKDAYKWGGPLDGKRMRGLTPRLKEMRRETIDLRARLSEKKFQLERELLSETPDKLKIDNLRKEIDELSKELDTIREKHRTNKQ
ncbi:MAG: hypothetical protein N2202_06905 [Proteobacteria bacterium]|nr:hypothetical protein [Pseudomonadota bacterium]